MARGPGPLLPCHWPHWQQGSGARQRTLPSDKEGTIPISRGGEAPPSRGPARYQSSGTYSRGRQFPLAPEEWGGSPRGQLLIPCKGQLLSPAPGSWAAP